jgi:hypothetical protein
MSAHRLAALAVVGLLALGAAPAAPAVQPPSAPGQDEDLSGTYTVKGTTAEGREYEGTCRISKEGDCYKLRWKIGEGSQTGLGIRQGEVLAVSFTDGKEFAGVVAYRIRGGRLTGKWAAFGGEGKIYTETLTKGE